jgi:uncharacterized protein YuzE
MKLHYHPETDCLYIELKDEGRAPASRRGRSWKGSLSISKVETIALPAATAAR